MNISRLECSELLYLGMVNNHKNIDISFHFYYLIVDILLVVYCR